MSHYFRYHSFERTSFEKIDRGLSVLFGLMIWCFVLLILVMTLGIMDVTGQVFTKLLVSIGGYSLVVIELLALFGPSLVGLVYFIPARIRNNKKREHNLIEETAAEANKTKLKVGLFIKECKENQ